MTTSKDILEELNELEDDPRPAERRYKVNDSTIEKAVELLNENPRGLTYHRDEIVGLLKKMDKPGHEQDRAFLIEAWNGSGSHTDDRIGRGTIKAENLCLSLCGTIQPGRLTSYIKEALSQDSNDGFAQRLQLMVHPDMVPYSYVDAYPNTEAKNRVFHIAKELSREDYFDTEDFEHERLEALFTF